MNGSAVAQMVVVAALAMLVGCAAPASRVVGTPRASERGQTGGAVVALVQSVNGPASIRVAYADLPVEPLSHDEAIAWVVGAGTVAVPLGLVAPAMFAGAFIVGGPLLLAAGAYAYGTEYSALATLRAAVAEADLPRAVVDAIVRRLGPARAGSTVVEVVIDLRGVGLLPRGAQEFCFVLGSDVTIALPGRPPLPVELRIDSVPPSESLLPPPQCASRDRFARDNGRLVRETARDYAEVLGAIVAQRLADMP